MFEAFSRRLMGLLEHLAIADWRLLNLEPLVLSRILSRKIKKKKKKKTRLVYARHLFSNLETCSRNGIVETNRLGLGRLRLDRTRISRWENSNWKSRTLVNVWTTLRWVKLPERWWKFFDTKNCPFFQFDVTFHSINFHSLRLQMERTLEEISLFIDEFEGDADFTAVYCSLLTDFADGNRDERNRRRRFA